MAQRQTHLRSVAKASRHDPGELGRRKGRRPWRGTTFRRRVLVAAVAGGCVVLATVVAILVAPSGHPPAAVQGPPPTLLPVVKTFNGLLAGVPQHGVILGQASAPVTLQVFIDLEDHGDGTAWIDENLPLIVEKFVRKNLVRLEFHSFKTDTLNRKPFLLQQMAALAAGVQNRLWNYVGTFMNEQGQEFTNYATEAFDIAIAKQVPGLNITDWTRALTPELENSVGIDNYEARHRFGLYVTPSFRIGLTGGRMKTLMSRVLFAIHKYIVHTRPSGERYIAGISQEWQHPVSLIDVIDLSRAVRELLCRRHEPCRAL